MSFPYKHVLLVGATSGIGAAMADRFIQEGSKVTAVGRRGERIEAFIAKHGKDRASGKQFDITNKEGTDAFVKSATTEHPDIDCVFLNAGTQHTVDLSKPEQVDLAKFHAEIDTNFTSLVDLAVKFLPFLMTKPSTLVFVGTHVSLVPAATLSAYCASKAALASFVLCLRDQVRESPVKVVDLWPPPVQTEIHDYLGAEKGRAFGMPVGEFVDQAYKELASGNDEIIVGTGPAPKEEFDAMVAKRREYTENLAKVMRASHW